MQICFSLIHISHKFVRAHPQLSLYRCTAESLDEAPIKIPKVFFSNSICRRFNGAIVDDFLRTLGFPILQLELIKLPCQFATILGYTCSCVLLPSQCCCIQLQSRQRGYAQQRPDDIIYRVQWFSGAISNWEYPWISRLCVDCTMVITHLITSLGLSKHD